MQSQVKGLEQAARNANDGISMLQVAEGAVSEISNILGRMKELAVHQLVAPIAQPIGTRLTSNSSSLWAEIGRI